MVTSLLSHRTVIDAVVRDGQVVKVVGTSDFPADATVGTSCKNTAAITIDGTIHHHVEVGAVPPTPAAPAPETSSSRWATTSSRTSTTTVFGMRTTSASPGRPDDQPVGRPARRRLPRRCLSDVDDHRCRGRLHVHEPGGPPAGVHLCRHPRPGDSPAGYLPTLTGQGTVATDSSTALCRRST